MGASGADVDTATTTGTPASDADVGSRVSNTTVASIVIGILAVIGFIAMVAICFHQKKAAAATAARAQVVAQTNPVYRGNGGDGNDGGGGGGGSGDKKKSAVYAIPMEVEGQNGAIYAVPNNFNDIAKQIFVLDEGGYVSDGFNPAAAPEILVSNA